MLTDLDKFKLFISMAVPSGFGPAEQVAAWLAAVQLPTNYEDVLRSETFLLCFPFDEAIRDWQFHRDVISQANPIEYLWSTIDHDLLADLHGNTSTSPDVRRALNASQAENQGEPF